MVSCMSSLDATTGNFTNHATLTLSDGTSISVQGSLVNRTLHVSFNYQGVHVTGTAPAVSSNRYAGSFTDASGTQTQGFWAATRATTTSGGALRLRQQDQQWP